MMSKFFSTLLLAGIAFSLVACKRHEESSSPDLRPESQIQKSETMSTPDKTLMPGNTNLNTLKDSATNSGITAGAGGSPGTPSSTNTGVQKTP